MTGPNLPTKRGGETNEDENICFTPQGDPTHYEMEFIQCQVQNALYRLPLYVFDDSPPFLAALIDACVGTGEQGDNRIITLKNVTIDEMDSFLKVLDARHLYAEHGPSFDPICLLKALRLAALWDFQKCRAFIQSLEAQLDEVDPVTILELAKEAGVPHWTHPAFRRLCERAELLTTQEATRLGLELAMAVCRIREQCRGILCKHSLSYKLKRVHVSEDTFTRLVEQEHVWCDLTSSTVRIALSIENTINAADPHATYYVRDEGFRTIQVENRLYNLPKTLLKQSEFFHHIVEHAYAISEAEDTTDERPIVVNAVSDYEMRCFASLLNARVIEGGIPFTFEQFAHALHVATVFQFFDIRSRIITRILDQFKQYDPIAFIGLGFRCNIPSYVTSAYVRLCEQAESLSGADCRRLGYDRFAAVHRVRCRRAEGRPNGASTKDFIQQEPDLDVPI